VLAAELVELPRGARLSARTSDINRTECYIDTLNPVPHGSRVRVRIAHEDESFEATARIVYVCDVSAPRHLSRGLAQDVSVEILRAQTTRSLRMAVCSCVWTADKLSGFRALL
jgi:hypothetical protein